MSYIFSIKNKEHSHIDVKLITQDYISFYRLQTAGTTIGVSNSKSLAYNWLSKILGDDGFFKIKRGNNECGIESVADVGIPDLERSSHSSGFSGLLNDDADC